MTYLAWAEQGLPDGEHLLTDLPLDTLHPLLHGGMQIRLKVSGGVITDCAFDVHSAHRGDEKLLEVRDLRQGLALVNRHGWLTASFAETLYARLAESMLGITPSARARALRDLALTLNSAATEALWAHLEACLSGVPSEALLEREQWLGRFERLTGARMHPTFVRIGGVGADADPDLLDELEQLPETAVAAAAVRAAEGPITTSLPKVVRLPVGDAYDEIMTPHGVLGIWLVSRGDKVPHRVHLRTAGFTALAALEREAAGMGTTEFLLRLARTRCTPGEIAR